MVILYADGILLLRMNVKALLSILFPEISARIGGSRIRKTVSSCSIRVEHMDKGDLCNGSIHRTSIRERPSFVFSAL